MRYVLVRPGEDPAVIELTADDFVVAVDDADTSDSKELARAPHRLPLIEGLEALADTCGCV
jgi:hypothetical protein